MSEFADEWVDRSIPSWPRSVTRWHVAADADHAPAGRSAYGDAIFDECQTCGLSTTSDGKRHGSDDA